MNRLRRILPALALLLALLAASLAYLPGLSGAFLFDDLVNLDALGAYGPIDNSTAFWRYLTSGTADPTGRPLALLSFLVDARDWPANAYAFKRTNVLLHLLNGVLLALLLWRLGRSPATLGNTQPAWSAALAATLWLLHPLFVSTTLYIVQREAMLPATFTLLGLLGYVIGHERTIRGRCEGIWLAAAAITVCTVLAVASKANGMLLPMLAWIVDALVLRSRRMTHDVDLDRRFARMRRAFLVLPSIFVLAWLAYTAVIGFTRGISPYRAWTLGERLLTESRIVVEYLELLWLPRPYTRGLFNDGYAVSTGLMSPWSTASSIAVLGTLIVAALCWRRRFPVLCAAILFFFTAHLLESTVVPLELYYEHRNYLPAMLIFWPLAVWLCASSDRTQLQGNAIHLFPLRRLLAVGLPLLLAGMTFLRASLWGDVADQAVVWGERNPNSPRAQAYAAQVELGRGHAGVATLRLEAAAARHPGEIQIAFNLIDARCATGSINEADIQRAELALRSSATMGRLAYDWIANRTRMIATSRCRNLDVAAIDRFVSAMALNPRAMTIAGRRQDMLDLRAEVAILRHDIDTAALLFREAFDAEPSPATALQQAARLGYAGRPDLGIIHLDHAQSTATRWRRPPVGMPMIHAWLLKRQGYWTNEMTHLRKKLSAEACRRTSFDPDPERT